MARTRDRPATERRRPPDSGLVGSLKTVPEDTARALKEADRDLEDTIRRMPLLDHLLDWRPLLLAAALGLVAGGVVRLLLGPWLAIAVFLVVFLGLWVLIAARRTGD